MLLCHFENRKHGSDQGMDDPAAGLTLSYSF